MPDNSDTQPQENTTPEPNRDPLGILGWVIGGKYKINSYLGGGGFGEVYDAFNENLPEQRLVVKFFKRVQAREKFNKEAKILCMLDHPNICRVIDFLPDEGAVVVAFIDGQDGGVILKESGALPEQLFLKVARSISSAIAYAHQKKIAHRDIKPANIIVDKGESVFLIDFGIAKEMGTDATKTAYTALTPMFAAPERQSGDKNYNPFISDVYETGITMFNLATNSLPYRNPTNPDVSEWGGVAARRLSPELTRILKKATHPDPAKRYIAASEMAEDMKNLDVAFGKSRKRSPLPIIVGLIVILAVAGYFGRGYLADSWAKLFPPGQEEAQITNPPVIEEEQSTAIAVDSSTQQEEQSSISNEVVIPEEETQKPPETAPPVGTAIIEEEEKPVLQKQTPPVQEEQSPVIAEETVAEEPEPEVETPPPPPPPPPKSNVLLAVIPNEGVTMTVGDIGRQSGQRFEIDPGQYDITVIQSDFPVFRGTLDAVAGPVEKAIDLAQEFVTLDTVQSQIALIPPTDNGYLEFIRNGRKRTIHNFPHLGMTLPAGEWFIELRVVPIGAAAGIEAQVDSCVIFPHNPQLRNSIQGSSGFLRVISPESQNISTAGILVYWSEK